MRLSSNQIFNQGVDSILDSQERMVKAQDRLTNQTKLLTPSDDPAATAQVMRLNEKIELTKQYDTNATILTNSLNTEEVAINSIKESLFRARSLTIQAGSGSLADADRAGIAGEIEQIINELYDSMNTKNASGDYIFAGFQSKSQPFLYNQTTDIYDYMGDEGELKLQISPSVQVSAGNNGKEAFENIATRLKTDPASWTSSGVGTTPQIVTVSQGTFDLFHAATYSSTNAALNDFTVEFTGIGTYEVYQEDTPRVLMKNAPFDPIAGATFQGMNIKAVGTPPSPAGSNVTFTLSDPDKQNILDTLNDLQQALVIPGGMTPALSESLNDAMVQIDNSSANLAVIQSSVGGRLNVTESILASNTEISHANQKTRADLGEIDYAVAVTDLMREESALEAAQATFGRVSKLSLFDYIR
jgi:flagellar hook-associated protein 3 FlgL